MRPDDVTAAGAPVGRDTPRSYAASEERPHAIDRVLARVTGALDDHATIKRWLEVGVELVLRRPPQVDELDDLVDAALPHLRQISSKLGENTLGFEADGDGVFWMDRVLGAYLAPLGSAGAQAAKLIHGAAMESWEEYLAARAANGEGDEAALANWTGECPHFARYVAQVVWLEEVEPFRRQAKRLGTSALSSAVLAKARIALWSRDSGISETSRGRAVAEAGEIGAFLRATDAAAVPSDSAVTALLRATRSVAGHRLLRYLVSRGHLQRCDRFIRDPRKVIVSGGFVGLARLLGMGPGKGSCQLRSALEAMQHLQLDLPAREVGGLLTWSLKQEAPGRPAELHVVLGDALLPDLVFSFGKTTAAGRAARKLVPLPEMLPPLTGPRYWHASIVTLQVLVLSEMREQARALVETGSVPILGQRWTEMAAEAGLPSRYLQEVLGRWISGTPANPPFLVQPMPGRFSLADAYVPELQFLREAGAAEQKGRRAAEIGRRLKRRLFLPAMPSGGHRNGDNDGRRT